MKDTSRLRADCQPRTAREIFCERFGRDDAGHIGGPHKRLEIVPAFEKHQHPGLRIREESEGAENTIPYHGGGADGFDSREVDCLTLGSWFVSPRSRDSDGRIGEHPREAAVQPPKPLLNQRGAHHVGSGVVWRGGPDAVRSPPDPGPSARGKGVRLPSRTSIRRVSLESQRQAKLSGKGGEGAEWRPRPVPQLSPGYRTPHRTAPGRAPGGCGAARAHGPAMTTRASKANIRCRRPLAPTRRGAAPLRGDTPYAPYDA